MSLIYNRLLLDEIHSVAPVNELAPLLLSFCCRFREYDIAFNNEFDKWQQRPKISISFFCWNQLVILLLLSYSLSYSIWCFVVICRIHCWKQCRIHKNDNKTTTTTTMDTLLAAIAIDSESSTTRWARSSTNFVTYFQQQQQKIYKNTKKTCAWWGKML